MGRPLRTIWLGLAAAAVIVAALVWLASGPGGADPTRTPTAAADSAAATPVPAGAGARRDTKLELPTRGHPLVRVRSGEHIEIRSAPGGGEVVRKVGDRTEFGSRTMFGVARTRDGWAGVPTPYGENGRLGWIRLDPRKLSAGYTRYSVVVDLSEHRAELLHGDSVARTFTVTIGAPDTTTPTGSFAVTDTFRGNLNPAYGCCAVALTAVQPNVPSGWLGGDRIAIHGTSGPLGVAASSGCVRAADRDVSALVNALPPGAPVTVRA
jgi:L,D-transpeptidase catalytic domain